MKTKTNSELIEIILLTIDKMDPLNPISSLNAEENQDFNAKISALLDLFKEEKVEDAISLGYDVIDHYSEQFGYLISNSSFLDSIIPVLQPNTPISAKLLSFCSEISFLYICKDENLNKLINETFISFISSFFSPNYDVVDYRNAIACLNNIFCTKLIDILQISNGIFTLLTFFHSFFYEIFCPICLEQLSQIQEDGSDEGPVPYYKLKNIEDETMVYNFELVKSLLKFFYTILNSPALYPDEIIELISDYCFICLKSRCLDIYFSALETVSIAARQDWPIFPLLFIKAKINVFVFNAFQLKDKYKSYAIDILKNIIRNSMPSYSIDLLRDELFVQLIHQGLENDDFRPKMLSLIANLAGHPELFQLLIEKNILLPVFQILETETTLLEQKTILGILDRLLSLNLSPENNEFYQFLIENGHIEQLLQMFQLEIPSISEKLYKCLFALINFEKDIVGDINKSQELVKLILEANEDLEDPFSNVNSDIQENFEDLLEELGLK